jgi:hypothetical protein
MPRGEEGLTEVDEDLQKAIAELDEEDLRRPASGVPSTGEQAATRRRGGPCTATAGGLGHVLSPAAF